MAARERRNRGTALVGVLLLGVASCSGTPATQKAVVTPDTAARLARRSIACERRVGELNERKIDGRQRYDKAVAVVAEFVDYYAGALDDTVDEKKTREMLDNVQAAVSDFLTWADEQLGADKASQPLPLETGEMAGELVRFWNENDRRWRQAVAVELKASKPKDWDEVIKRPAGVMP